MNNLFPENELKKLMEFYHTRDEWEKILEYRKLTTQIKPVENIFFGDSITWAWPLQEFFPTVSLLSRGIPGDNIIGLNYRLDDDVLAYSPRRVFMLVGINGIEADKNLILARIKAVTTKMTDMGIEVYLSSILPLRYPDSWNRFQYQNKIVEINHELADWSHDHATGFLDYHSILKDDCGQLAAEYAMPDGTHITFAAYRRMSELIFPILRLSDAFCFNISNQIEQK